MKILAIDPGHTQSAFVLMEDGRLTDFAKLPNAELLAQIAAGFTDAEAVALEQIASYGMAVGEEVFETIHWSGRFHQAAAARSLPVYRVKRLPIKLHHCHSPKANDSNIRQAIVDRYGGKDTAIGKKKTPGPLYGVSADVWAALALGLYHVDTYTPIGE